MTEVIRDLPVDERPRERMLRHGASTLSDAELLATLLSSGIRGKNAIAVARELLGDGLTTLAAREPAQLAAIPGIGVAKAARIAAAMELARRLGNPSATAELPLYEMETLGRQLLLTLSRVAQERLGAVFLDSRNQIRAQREIYIGTINSAFVSTRDIIRHALVDHNASAVVVYHNHPSGNPVPSGEDLEFTRKLKASLNLVDVDLIDHLIIGSHRYTSMRENGQL